MGRISIHALLAESDCCIFAFQRIALTFLSTLSLRRATLFALLCNLLHHDFYPRSPCGERQLHVNRTTKAVVFLSTLSLRRATTDMRKRFIEFRFLSTLSLRRATQSSAKSTPEEANFYPRSPCGERRAASITPTASRNFYPRSPCGERQRANRLSDAPPQISIHALLAESDPKQKQHKGAYKIFLSTLSLRRATHVLACGPCRIAHFYPRSPCGERPHG